jgi:hypothetical protein
MPRQFPQCAGSLDDFETWITSKHRETYNLSTELVQDGQDLDLSAERLNFIAVITSVLNALESSGFPARTSHYSQFFGPGPSPLPFSLRHRRFVRCIRKAPAPLQVGKSPAPTLKSCLATYECRNNY